MSDKKINSKMLDKFLNLHASFYKEEYGDAIQSLEKYDIFTVDPKMYEEYMPEIFCISENGIRTSLMTRILAELERKGFVYREALNATFDTYGKSGSVYHLTEKGFIYATKPWYEKCLDFFNENSGLAIPISLVSIIISIIALFLS